MSIAAKWSRLDLFQQHLLTGHVHEHLNLTFKKLISEQREMDFGNLLPQSKAIHTPQSNAAASPLIGTLNNLNPSLFFFGNLPALIFVCKA